MKTKLITGLYNSDDIEKRILIDPPYTVFGHTSLSPSFFISMKVGGLRKILNTHGLEDDDALQVVANHDKATEYYIITKKKGKR